MFLRLQVLLLATLTILPNIASGAEILVFVGLASKSHLVATWPLAAALADRGHQVTFVAPMQFDKEHPTVNKLIFPFYADLNEKTCSSTSQGTMEARLKDRYFNPIAGTELYNIYAGVTEQVLEDPEFTTWMRTSKFDVIIQDYPGEEFLFAWAYQMKAKTVALFTVSSTFESDVEIFGISDESSWFRGMEENNYPGIIPDMFFYPYKQITNYLFVSRNYLPRMEGVIREKMQWEFPALEGLMRDVDLVLLNDHFSASWARPYPPNVVSVGGMHCQDSNGSLSLEASDFIKDAKSFVFISFGSIISVSKLPPATQQLLFDAVAAFPAVKFLWKWEGEAPKNLPSNALAKPWFRQQDVLAHPKCKGFVTHAGQMSTQEAIYHAVPVVAVPGFGDQHFNARAAEEYGYGIYVELTGMTVAKLTDAIRQILEDDKYLTTMKEVSQRFRDRPMSPVNTAVWWTEYILRQNSSSMKSHGIYLSWWGRRSLVFWGLLFTFYLSFIYLFFILKKIVSQVIQKKKVT